MKAMELGGIAMYEMFFSDPSLVYRIDVINSIDFYELGFEMVRGEEVAEGVLKWPERGETAAVLLTNTHLSDMSGFELAELVRKRCPRIRVIFLADSPNQADARKAVLFGAYDYLLKSDGINALRDTLTRVSKDLYAESREAEFLRSQSSWDEIVPRMLSLLAAFRQEKDEDNWRVYSRVKPLLFSDSFRAEELFVRSLMEELRWEICSRDEQLAMQLRDQMMQIPVQSLSSAQATAELLDTIRSRLSERGLICGGDALRSDSIGRACVYMHTHIAEKLTAQNMAAYVHISPRHFIRKFQSEMNESFSEYLRRIRIKAAIRMLEEGGDIKSIPAAVGYKDEKSFHAVFREYVGCSMREYQRKLNLSQREDTQP